MRISDWSSDVGSSDLVDEAFKEVTAARQERESAINLARAYEQQVLERARGDTSAFDQIYAQYELAPEVTRKPLYYETMENVLSNVDTTIIEDRKRGVEGKRVLVRVELGGRRIIKKQQKQK